MGIKYQSKVKLYYIDKKHIYEYEQFTINFELKLIYLENYNLKWVCMEYYFRALNDKDISKYNNRGTI